MELSEVIFWEISERKINWKEKASYVIPRVAMYGQLEDWEKVKSFYGIEKVKEELIKTRYLDKKTLNFMSVIFNIPKENFRCYTLKQSTPKHWDF